jgi:flagellar motor switch protein FliN/FliY
MSEGEDLDLPELDSGTPDLDDAPPASAAGTDVAVPAETKADDEDPGDLTRSAADLEAVFDVPVSVSAVLGRAHMEVSDLLKLDAGTVLELDRKVGEAIDIYVNNRLVARGEVVMVDDRLGVTMTEIIKSEKS